MPQIEIECLGFPQSSRFYSQAEEFSWDDILWAAMTVGRANWLHVFQYGNSSLWEAICRIAMVRMTLCTDLNHTNFFCTSAFRALDPSEKGAVSYFIGMAMCKLLSERFLQVPWLMHLDVYRSQINVSLLSGRSRPDLIGPSLSGDWVVFESKGRSSKPDREDKNKAKIQASRISQINNQQVRYNIALFSYYASDDCLKIYCEDPPADEQEEIHLTVKPDMLIQTYYNPLIEFIGEHALRNQLKTGEFTSIEQDDFSIGIEPELIELLLREDHRGACEYLAKSDDRRTDAKNAAVYKLDGVCVKAGETWKKLLI